MDDVILESIIEVDSFKNKNWSGAGVDVFDSGDVVRLLSVEQFLVDVGAQETLHFSVEEHHVVAESSEPVLWVGKRCLKVYWKKIRIEGTWGVFFTFR